ncbi:MAG: hypothetical protein RLZZ299_2537 [Pseudomonadota bacterium]|jgi:SAM-dependent methyltransferase/uncharacterized protein YbaR (Trm112 family)
MSLGTGPVLVCPRCRHGGSARTLVLVDDDLLGCVCGALHPVIDGVPVVFRDAGPWLASEAVEALARRDLPPRILQMLREAVPTLARNDSLLTTYRRSDAGPLQHWLRDALRETHGEVLELGSGIGVTARDDVVALDHNLAMLRAHPARAKVCADLLDPPFLPHSFDAVVLANVLDSCRDPWVALGQADALLRPGGTLVLTCAYAFHEDVTPRAAWFDRAGLQEVLGQLSARYEVLRDDPEVPWPLTVGTRERRTLATDAWILRKTQADAG